jgi:uncharacterized protein (TIGR02996 family)
MTAGHEAFLDAILQDPNDWSRRVAFASWLEEQRDPSGALIRIDLEIDRIKLIPCHCRWCSPRLPPGYAFLQSCNKKPHYDKLWPKHKALLAQGAIPLHKMLAERKAALGIPSNPPPAPPPQLLPTPERNRPRVVRSSRRLVSRPPETASRQDNVLGTEQSWLACADPGPMLDLLRGKASDRKLRLFACACCWSLRPFLQEARRRRPIEAAELFADRLATFGLMEAAAYPVPVAVSWVTWPDPFRAAVQTSHAAAFASAAQPKVSHLQTTWGNERASQADLLRCIIGNPFHPFAVDPAWLGWNQGTVPKIALAIYYDRAFEWLPILADALEDAGCGDPQILQHCRAAGPHGRGCWVVDALLGKEGSSLAAQPTSASRVARH